MIIRVIQQVEWVDGGEYISWAKRNGHTLLYTKCYEYEPIPTHVDADMLLVLGGPQSPATTKKECPFYDAYQEMELINKYANANKIVIGSCLGAQLVGEALGGKFITSPYPEVGYVRGILTEEGKKDPLFKDFPEVMQIGSWHEYMPGLSVKAEVIMRSDGCPHQIVKYSRLVYGFQAHLEFNHDSFVNGIKTHEEELKRKGIYIRSIEEIMSFDTTEMNQALSSFLDNISEEYNK